jgi:hypothetical protein
MLLLSWVAVSAGGGTPAAADETFFELKVRPVLAGVCFRCHGGEKTSGGLRVDTRAALLKGGDSGPAIVAGDPDHSLLVRAVRHREGETLRMPPGKKLPSTVAADLETWVRRGAPWPATAGTARPFAAGRHWAFQPVRKTQPPADPSGWAAGPVDCFIAAGLRAHGLRPAPEADRRTLLRRVTFDLTGLPPTPGESAAFLADESPGAYEQVVERLLASPAYGERWGRHWLDVARYADTAGDNADYPVPEAALYRDWVIDAFNADLPYDAFVREQLAGDLLAARGPRRDYAGRVVATTFLGLSRRYLTAPYEHWHLTLEDAIETTGRAFLGLTLRCARCHDHKYDPVTREDYYALYGIFASTQFPYAGSEEFASMHRPREHFVPLVPPAEAAPHLEARRRRLDEVRAEIARQAKAEGAKGAKGPPNPSPLLVQRRAELATLERTNLPPELPGAYAVSEGKPTDVPVQLTGDPARPGPVVHRGVPKFLQGKEAVRIPASSSGRLELARWIASPDNPLTARVMANRVWQHHFGRGLVTTPSNFGLRGQPPSHPELLDWLAATFVEEGWCVKALHRHVVLSRTYRLASTPDPEAAARDPGNVWYGRADRRRMEAECVRDAMLAAAGRLDRRRPGPQPFPPLSSWGWTQHNPFKAVYPSAHRSIYLMTQRLQRHPFLALFDGPDANVTTDVRGSSTVPLQALYLMNDPFVREQAEGLARRVTAADSDPAGRFARACELTWGRPPTPAESGGALEYLRHYAQELARTGTSPGDIEREVWTSLARVLLCSNEFIYLD